ncbi:hypothetical protein ACF0H5_008048 [Mactra antiquata]
MSRINIVFICISAFVLVIQSEVNCISSGRTPQKYIVNLDIPAEKRWSHVVSEHRDFVLTVHKIMKSMVPKEIFPLVEFIAAEINNFIEQPYADEMKGIAKTLDCNVGDVVLATLIYDIASYCTSIVTQDSYGQIWHARNLDYSFTDLLKNITVEVDFQSNGKTQYSAVTFAGYVGIMTGQRPHAFTVTVNERDDGTLLWNILIDLLDKNAVSVSLLIRNALAYDHDFTSAVKRLSYTTTGAEAYIIVGGIKPGEGAVITKGHFKPDDVWMLNATDGQWFLVQTNYDHWKPPPPDDNRRSPATRAMNSMGSSNITVESLFHVMSTRKVLNEQTVHTTVMSAGKPALMRTWIRR